MQEHLSYDESLSIERRMGLSQFCFDVIVVLVVFLGRLFNSSFAPSSDLYKNSNSPTSDCTIADSQRPERRETPTLLWLIEK
jgi:hypothetical protein